MTSRLQLSVVVAEKRAASSSSSTSAAVNSTGTSSKALVAGASFAPLSNVAGSSKSQTAAASAAVASADTYIVKNAAIPSEAFYCTASSWRDLVIKTQQVWGLESPYFTFTATNAVDRVVTFRLTSAVDFEAIWINNEEQQQQTRIAEAKKKLSNEAEECRQSPYSLARSGATTIMRTTQLQTSSLPSIFFGSKLLAHDHRVTKHVAHSSELYTYGIRPLVSPGLLSFWPARYCMRHTVTDEILLVCEERESPSWGYAIQKAQKEWGVLRPIFRYVDDLDSSGERLVVSIVTAEDFQLWMRRRRPLWPELLVFEHAAPNLLQGHRSQMQQMQIASQAALGISPLEADIGGQVGYFPSTTNPMYQQQSGALPSSSTSNHNNSAMMMTENDRSGIGAQKSNAQMLLSSFRPESLIAGSISDLEKVQAEMKLLQVRETHMRELAKALSGESSPRRGNL